MIDNTVLLAFFTTSLILALSPGPDNLFVMAQSARTGRIAGLFVTLGLATGLIGHTVAVAFGLAAIIRASTLAFTALKFSGAAYLLYLAWQAFRAGAATVKQEDVQAFSRGNLYRRGIVMNITNPKVSLFFLAFLPQFADPRRGSMMLSFFSWEEFSSWQPFSFLGSLVSLLEEWGEKFSSSPLAQKIVNRIASAVFVGLALKLALSER